MNEPGPMVLVVEDDRQMRRFLLACLESHAYRVIEAGNLSEALRDVTTRSIDLVLLDLGLPDGDGIDLTRKLREWSRVPIIVISARGQEEDKVSALDAGADDYLTKPFGTNELLARMRAALRHARSSEGENGASVLTFGALRVDLLRREIHVDKHLIRLTPIEYKLLTLLARNAGKVLTHGQILKEVWGLAHAKQTHYVRVQMAELRKKIEADPAQPKWLVTEPGVGYRLRDRDFESDDERQE